MQCERRCGVGSRARRNQEPKRSRFICCKPTHQLAVRGMAYLASASASALRYFCRMSASSSPARKSSRTVGVMSGRAVREEQMGRQASHALMHRTHRWWRRR